MIFSGGTRSRLLFTAVIVVAAALGAVGGHLVWTATSSPSPSSTANRVFEPGHFPRGGGITGGCNKNRCRFNFGGGSFHFQSPGGGNSSGSAGNVASGITSKVDPALVDIDTDLGYQGGAAAGTGMVITSSGEVITNNHVIVGATKITATDVGNGHTYTARVVGYDPSHDIAVLQLEDASGLQTVSLGSSSSLSVGQAVATIGNAGGSGGTPSAASAQITGLDESITASDAIGGDKEHLHNLIGLNGDLEPGDSGGPLVNSSGDVIGMDTAASSTFQFQSSSHAGFAIPIDEVVQVAGDIVSGTSTSTNHIGDTAFLGVTVQPKGSTGGALVASVLSGTPAAGSSLSAGDVITALDGTSVATPEALTRLILQQRPGDSVKISWQTQSGAQQTASVTLASGPPQ